MEKDRWIQEVLHGGMRVSYKVLNALHAEETPFQNMQLVESESFGTMLLLDDIVQTTVGDEFVYHEMMTHVPLMAHPDPRQVLIIGGGDGGILREALRHRAVEQVVMVEIDGRVVEFCKKHLPSISDGAFDDSRVQVVIADGAEYVKTTKDRFDVVIVDSPDPVGPAEVLFAEEFYRALRDCLKPGGIMVRQTGSTFLQKDEQKTAYDRLTSFFEHVSLYVYAVPTYIGGFFSSVFASDIVDPLTVDRSLLTTRYRDEIESSARYYSPGIHVGAFELPGYVKRNLKR